MRPNIGDKVTIACIPTPKDATLIKLENGTAVVKLLDGKRLTINPKRILGYHEWDGAKPKPAARPSRPSVRAAVDVKPFEPSFAPQPKDASPARSRKYLDFVRMKPCCSCGHKPPCDPHHYGGRGMGQKTDDYRTVPLCRLCHDNFHSRGVLPGMDRPETRATILAKQVDLLVEFVRCELDRV